MVDKFERNIQRDILQILYEAYPEELTNEETELIFSKFGSRNNGIANLLYLEQHQLIHSGLQSTMTSYSLVNKPSITHKGIDFIRDDGGLGAILNIQTIKFHDSTIIALEDIIRVANLPPEKESGLISKLRELPADAIKHLTLELLTKGVMSLPAALPLIEKAIQQH